MVPESGRSEPRPIRLRAFTTPRRSPFSGEPTRPAREAKEGLKLTPNFTVRRYRDAVLSDNPTYLAQRPRILEGMRLAGVPEG